LPEELSEIGDMILLERISESSIWLIRCGTQYNDEDKKIEKADQNPSDSSFRTAKVWLINAKPTGN
jgi:hypothetical protein